MEVKANVRQRRIDRMKQILASGQRMNHDDIELPGRRGGKPAGQPGPTGRTEPSRGAGRTEPSRGGTAPYGSSLRDFGPDRDERFDDPEYVWKRERNKRWSSWEQGAGPQRERDDEGGGLKPPTARQIWVRLTVSAVLFGCFWGMFRIDHPLAERGQAYVRAALTEEYDFTAAAAWYERTFGGLPALLPALRPKAGEAQKAGSASLHKLYVPVHGKIVERASGGELGITIRTEPEATAVAIDTGIVVSVTTGTDKGTVLVLQHAGGLQSTYGWLESTSLKKHDWVEGGETIGRVTTDAAGGAGKLYVAVRKDNQFVDPTEVIAFD
jgi:stage IV sporulation protein FA